VTGDSVEVCAYQTRSWYDTFVSHFGMAMQLSSPHRQNPDDPLYSVLMRLRVGAPTEDDVNLLNSAWGVGGDDAWPNHQQLRAKNCDLGTVNDRRLAELPGESVTITCVDTFNVEHPDRQASVYFKLQKLSRGVFQVKPGAEVVLTRSVGEVMTGARGRVIRASSESVSYSFVGHEEAVEVGVAEFAVKDAMEQILGKRVQVPLLLAWAMTITRAQGMTLSAVAMDFGCTTWSPEGFLYSGCSRSVSFSTLRVRGLTRDHVRASPQGLQYYQIME